MKWLISILLLVSLCFGQYTFTTVDEIEYDTFRGDRCDVVALNDSIFAILHVGGSGSDTVLETYEVDSNYDNITQVDSLMFHTDYPVHSRLIKIEDDIIMAIATHGATETVYTFDYNASWQATKIDTFNFADMAGYYDFLNGVTTSDKGMVISGNNSVGYTAIIDWDDGTGDNIGQVAIDYPSNDHDQYVEAVAISDTLFLEVFEYNGDVYAQMQQLNTAWTTITEQTRWQVYTSYGNAQVARVDNTHALFAYTDYDGDRSFLESVSFTSGTGASLTSVDVLTESVMDTGLQRTNGHLERYQSDDNFIYFRMFNGVLNVRSYNVDPSTYEVTANSDSTKFSNIVPYGTTGGQLRADLLAEDSGSSTYVVIYPEVTSLDGYVAIVTATGAATGWSHKIMGVETPTKVNAAETFTKVSGVE